MAFPAPPATRPAERRLAGIALRLAAGSFFAIMAAGIKLGADRGVSLVELVFARNLFSLPVLALWLSAGPGWRAVRTRRPMAHLTRAGIGLSSMALTFLALTMLPLADATTISFSSPLFATLLSALVLGEVIGRHRWAAVAVGFAGVALAMQPAGTPLPALGLGIAVVAALSNAAVTITLRQIGATEGVAATVFWFTLACVVASGIAVPAFARSHDGTTLAVLVVMGLAGGVAQICNTGALRLAPVAVVAPFDYLQLVWAMLIGWMMWSTVPAPTVLAGGALIVASGLYTLLRERRLRRVRLPATPPEL